MGVQSIINDQENAKEAEIMQFVELKLSGSPISWHDFSKLGQANRDELTKQIQYEDQPA